MTQDHANKDNIFTTSIGPLPRPRMENLETYSKLNHIMQEALSVAYIYSSRNAIMILIVCNIVECYVYYTNSSEMETLNHHVTISVMILVQFLRKRCKRIL
jgi:hypothetical protein